MVQRFIRRGDGTVVYWRVVALLGTTIAMAIFGTALIWVVPSLTPSPVLRGFGVLVAVAALKVPLILVLWSFILRNGEWPGRRVSWSDDEVTSILEHLRLQADDAEGKPDRDARLAYLSREAWNVADQIEGERKVDALTVALRIDERLMTRRSREAA